MPNRSKDFRKLVYLARANLAARVPGTRFMAVRFVDELELFLQER